MQRRRGDADGRRLDSPQRSHLVGGATGLAGAGVGGAAASGGGHVTLRGARDDRGVTLAVVDDGPGVPPDRLAHIFDPFYTTKHKGTGLGLATSHAIVAEHGGTLDVESVPGRTTFTLRLPARG